MNKSSSLHPIRQHIAFALTLLVGASFFLWVLINEYQSNERLLENNRKLLLQTINKTWQDDLDALRKEYPESLSKTLESWNKWLPNFFWFKQGMQAFPFQLSTEAKLHWQAAHKYYLSEVVVQKDDGRNERRQLTLQVIAALRSGDELKLRGSLLKFLAHKELYQFGAVDEIASYLALLTENNQQPWSKEIVESVLFSGFSSETTQIPSVMQLLITQSGKVHRDDGQDIYHWVEKIAEAYNLQYPIYAEYYRTMLTTPQALPAENLPSIALYGSNHLLFSDSETLVIPFDIKQQVAALEKKLMAQFVLLEQDRLLLSNSLLQLSGTAGEIRNISEIEFVLKQPDWERAVTQNKFFFVVKVSLLALLLALLVIVYVSTKRRESQRLGYLKLREDFVNLISHELKTPIASIRLMTETIQKRLKKSLSLKDYPERILSESDKLWMLVDNILSFNRLNSNMERVEKQWVTFADILDEAMDNAIFDGIELHNDVPKQLELKGDKWLLSLVLKNIISNALKYSSELAPKVAFSYRNESSDYGDARNDNDFSSDSNIRIEERAGESRHGILVSDNGIGIGQAQWDKVFSEFFREGRSDASGSGIGLALCRRILKVHQGEIFIVNSSEKGTDWFVRLSHEDMRHVP